MQNDIAFKILEQLNDCGLDTQQISFKELIDKSVGSLKRPAINISVNTGQFKKVTMNTKYLANPVFSLFILLADLRSEPRRRERIADLLEAIVECLLFQDFGLCLESKMRPMSFSNATTEDFANAGYLVFQIDFTCSYIISKTEINNPEKKLISIVNNFFLQTPNDDGIVDLTSTVLLYIIGGANAYTKEYTSVINGGRAGTKHNSQFFGGNAYTEFSEDG